ncbi:MAG: hypothetical protein NVSMB7_06160 [Chitinophagaceae bacterium]
MGASNQRTDEYGGFVENRSRILFGILGAFKGIIEYNRVGIRFNPSAHNLFGMLVDELTIPTFEYIIKRLNDYGLAYIHLTEPFTLVHKVPFAVSEVAKHFRPLYNGTLIINKSFNKETGNKIVEDNNADLVAFGALSAQTADASKDPQICTQNVCSKIQGVVYHFYCAVNKKDQRGIAVASSVDKGKSILRFAGD